MISKILVANRGEIAVRIIRAARELNIPTVQAVSKADHQMLAAQLADEVVEIGPAHAAKSYLNGNAIIAAAKSVGADAIHPGYGFLAESPEFAEAVELAGITFIGPSSATIRSMGDKAIARGIASQAGIRTVPGSQGRVAAAAHAEELVAEIGLPVMIKAAAGGGGRGIRVATSVPQLEELLHLASTEAKAAFGDGGLYLERFIPKARHLEVQILGDGNNVIHLYERECSIQRRRQKVWEEAPACCLDDATREALCASAVRLAKFVNYRGAGTLEFLYDEAAQEFFFIEMNTRIQVEHPVTEMVTGVDLVKEMIRVAAGEPLSITQNQVCLRGHAIECRINAEDPHTDFQPSPGTITDLVVPQEAYLRFDSGIYEGYSIPPFYDSLLGKLIAWGETRESALSRMGSGLAGLSIGGIKTTVPLQLALAHDPEMAELSTTHTRWLEQWLEKQPPFNVAVAL